MASENKHDINKLKPGSSAADAAKVGGKADFGVPEGDRAEREYTSENTRRADPGAAPAMSNENRQGNRTSGAGGNASGRGSSSGGDMSTTFAGVDGHGPLAENIDKQHHDGPDDAQQFGTPDRAERAKTKVEPSKGHVAFGTAPDPLPGEGADAAGRESIPGDSSFVGEVSSSEASGRDDAGK